MIGFFPFCYPDELLYSQLCRYHIRSGNLTYTMSSKDLYARSRTVIPDTLFLNRFNEDALGWICNDSGIEEVIEKRTMFPAFGRFIPKDKRKEAFNALVMMEGNWNNLLKIPNIGTRYLRYCPACAKEDRNNFGETYYHRHHQIYRLEICPKHRCYLEDTDAMSSKMSPGFYDAETFVPNNKEPRYCNNDTELKLAEYVTKIFDEPIDIDNDYSIGYFLNTHIPSKYVTKSGLVRSITELYEDYKSFYKNECIIELQQLQKILNGYRFDNYNICQIAMFLGISEKELVNMPKEMIVVGIDALYKSLSLQFDIEFDVVRHIGEEILKYSRGRTYLARKSGPRERAWAELDNAMLPKVKEYVDMVLSQNGRPVKISISMVQKALELPQKQVSKLPQCLEYIKSKMETYPEFWAREIEWAVNEIDTTGIELKPKRICEMLSLTNTDIQNSIEYIRDTYVKERLINMFTEEKE